MDGDYTIDWTRPTTPTTVTHTDNPATYRAVKFSGVQTAVSANPIPCAWCDPNHYLLRYSITWWVRSNYGKRRWMSVTKQNKAQYCPMCGRKLEEEG